MTTHTTAAGQSGIHRPPRAIMPPYLVLHDFLDAATVAGLLEFAVMHESAFTPTRTRGHEVRPELRISAGTRDLGPFDRIIRDRLRALVPEMTKSLRITAVANPKFELELVAHNDGAFFKPHIDTKTATSTHSLRVISGVYYFHDRPKAFSGGALRLFAIGDPDNKTFVDIEPVHNTLLVFPSWAPHEVRPIACPSKRFADSRFAVNAWVHQERA